MVKESRKYWPMVSAYSFAHFVMDFSCAFLMFRFIAETPQAMLCVLLYNFCAFALQMPIGLIADKANRNVVFALCGCLLALAAYLFVGLPLAAVLVAGVGNALFHIGGAIDVLNVSKVRLSALGLFVSPGAFGVYLGTLLGRGSSVSALWFPAILVAAAALILLAKRVRNEAFVQNVPLSLEGLGTRRFLIAAACFFLVVCLRSFLGLSLDFDWKGVGYWGVSLACALVFGKALGGFAADRFGITRTACVSLGSAALLFLLSGIAPAGLAAVLLFNMTMPITLFAMAKIMPGARGFAFGLLTFGIFLGFLPVYLGLESPSGAPWFFALVAAVSLVILWLGLKRTQ